MPSRGKKRWRPARPDLRGPQWRKLRAAALERDGRRCRYCGGVGRLEVDHIRPVSRGGAPYDPANLQTLCRRCHIRKTKAEREGPPLPKSEADWRALVDSTNAVS